MMQARFLAGVIDDAADAELFIVDDNHVGARKRLDIYRHNYRASLTGVLTDHFARLFAYLGDEQFGRVARAYIAGHRSTTRNLRDYGHEFATFLGQNFPEDGELAELAALDWGLRAAFDAADVAHLDTARVGALGNGWIDRPLSLHPSARMLNFSYNSAAIWSALDARREPPPVAELAGPVRLLVWRRRQQPSFRSLTAEEAEALDRLATGCNFINLSARAIEACGESAAMAVIAEWLGTWLADGILVTAD
ncbi:MAG: putative DNA-binding domain-containing protein [Sphingopyxis sp.]|nr:putative DNA-binding domain-containing protein [Sphingopyxis sp.]